jgi:membrane fusion protein (multidrug efflux system)
MTRTRVLLAVVLVLVVAGALAGWKMFSGKESTDDARVDGHVYPVSAKVGGTVDSVEVVENQVVETNAVLLRIDDRNFRIALQRAEADLANAMAKHREVQTQLPVSAVEAAWRNSSSQAALVRAQGMVTSAQKDLEVARARLTTALARVKEAQVNTIKTTRDLDRVKPLIAKDEISQQQYDNFVGAAEGAKAAESSAHAAVAEAESGVALAEARVNEARGNVGVAESDVEGAAAAPQQVTASQARISGASAEIERARAAVDQARLDLEHTVVRAPVAGIVSRKNVEIGTVIQPGQPLMAVVPLDDLWITANFKETQLREIRPGQTAEIQVDTYGNTIFHARVDSISAATGARFSLLPPENASGNFVKVVQRVPVKLVLTDKPDPEHTLRPGMSAEVTVLTGIGGN